MSIRVKRPWPARQTGSCLRRRGTGTAFGWRWSLATMLPAGSALTTRPGMPSLRYRGGRRRRGHFGIESPTAGLVSGALPPGLAGSGASRPLQLGFASQPARNARRTARRNPRLGAIAAGLAIVSLETRENAVTELSLRRVADALGPGRMARVILGLETSDDHRREELLAKRMPRAAVSRAVEAIAFGGGRFGDRSGLD